MGITARQLITSAYHLSGVVSPGFQTTTGEELSKGLLFLNEVLAETNITGDLVSFYDFYEFDTIAQQEEYFIENLILIDSITFNLDTVRYPLEYVTRKDYQGSGRADNIYSLPFQYTTERAKGGLRIFFYFIPDIVYPIKIWGKLDLAQIPDKNYEIDLSDTYEPGYITFLRYATARYICHDYDRVLNPDTMKKLREYELKFYRLSPPDFSMVKVSTLGTNRVFPNYGYANLGNGWEP